MESSTDQARVKQIVNNPKYQKLVTTRRTFSWILAIEMLTIYYAFILVIAFSPASLGTPIAEGSLITVGIPIGVAIIVAAFVLTGIYVFRANGEFDELTRQIKEEAK